MPEYYRGKTRRGRGGRTVPEHPLYTNIPATAIEAEQYGPIEARELPERTPTPLPDVGDIYAQQERDYDHAQTMKRSFVEWASKQGASSQDIKEAIDIKGWDKVKPPSLSKKPTEKQYKPPDIILESKELVDMGVAPDIKSAYKMAKEAKEKKVTKEEYLANAYQNILKNEMYAGDDEAIAEAMQQTEKYYDEKLNPKKVGGVSTAPEIETKQLDAETAKALVAEAGGDKDKARQLARDRGYTF